MVFFFNRSFYDFNNNNVFISFRLLFFVLKKNKKEKKYRIFSRRAPVTYKTQNNLERLNVSKYIKTVSYKAYHSGYKTQFLLNDPFNFLKISRKYGCFWKKTYLCCLVETMVSIHAIYLYTTIFIALNINRNLLSLQ